MRLVRGLAAVDAARIVAARTDQPFDRVDDMWRRSGVPAASLVELAEADAFLPSLELQRRDALWAIKALRDEPLPLFAAAAEREMKCYAQGLVGRATGWELQCSFPDRSRRADEP